MDFLFPGMSELARRTPERMETVDPRALMIRKRLEEVQGSLGEEERRVVARLLERNEGNLGGLLRIIGEGPYPRGKMIQGRKRIQGSEGEEQMTFDAVSPPRGSKGEIDYLGMKVAADREAAAQEEMKRKYESDTATGREWVQQTGHRGEAKTPLRKELRMMAEGIHPTGVKGNPAEMMAAKGRELEASMGKKLKVLEESRNIQPGMRTPEQAAAWSNSRGAWKDASDAFGDFMDELSRVSSRKADELAGQMPEMAKAWKGRVEYFMQQNLKSNWKASGLQAKAIRAMEQGRWSEAVVLQKMAGVWAKKGKVVDYGPVKMEDPLGDLPMFNDGKKGARIGGKRLELKGQSGKVLRSLESQLKNLQETGERYKPRADDLSKALYGEGVGLKEDGEDLEVDLKGHDEDFFSVKTEVGEEGGEADFRRAEYDRERKGVARLEEGASRKAFKSGKGSEVDNVIGLLRGAGRKVDPLKLEKAIQSLEGEQAAAQGTLWEGWVGNKLRNAKLLRAASGGKGAEALEAIRVAINEGRQIAGMNPATLKLFKALSLL